MRSITEPQLARLLGDWPGPPGRGSGRAAGPGYVRLAAQVRALLLDARLPAGVRLPAERRLASTLGLSRTTIAAAYRLLREEGYLASRQGSGSVTALPPGRLRRYSPWVPAVPDDEDAIDLALASPEACPDVPAAMSAAIELLPAYLHGHGYDSYGLPVLREAVARRFTERGLPTGPDQIFVTSGAQHALDLLLRCLASPLDPVMVENPTYPNTLDALARARARVVAVGLAPDGWDLDLLTAALRQSLPRLGYLMPDFHNPAGHLMNGPDRAAVADAAAAAGTRLVIDETFAELALGAPGEVSRPAPLAAFDPAGQVITIGSMSKAFWAGLRVGWVRADPGLVAQLQAVRSPSDLASPVVEQLAAAWLLDRASGLLPARRELLTGRRDTLAAALARHFPAWQVRLPAGGLSLWARLEAPVSTALVYAAEQHRLRLVPGPRFGPPGHLERYLRLPFSLPGPDLAEAVIRLAAAHASLRHATPPFPSAPAQVA
ncbi:MAG TPA: PLP-dependent aminotransferase family protein [Streptosporangiaceae bacterium]